jgi:hypothetical protein
MAGIVEVMSADARIGRSSAEVAVPFVFPASTIAISTISIEGRNSKVSSSGRSPQKSCPATLCPFLHGRSYRLHNSCMLAII